MAEEPEQYNLTAIRRVLLQSFNTDELDDLFYFAETVELRVARNEYVPHDSLRTKIRKAMDYCERRGLLHQLVAEIEEARPGQSEVLRAEARKAERAQLEAEERARREAEAAEEAARLEAERLACERQEAAERRKVRLLELYRNAADRLAERDWAGGRELLIQIEEMESGFLDVPALLQQANVELARAQQVDGLMAQGTENLEEGKWWLASEAFRQVLVLVPDHAQAQAHLQEAEQQEAIAGSLVKGQNCFRSGRWAEAIACFEAVLEVDPKQGEATGLLEEARAQERARLEEESRQAQEARDAQLRQEVLQAERTRLYDEGCAAAQEKDWPKAIKRFEAVLKIDPDNLDTANRLAHARARRDEMVRRSWEEAGFGFAQFEDSPSSGQDLLRGRFRQEADAKQPQRTPARQSSAAKSGDWGTVRTLRGHTGKVCRAAFGPDSNWLVTAGEDKTARVWDVGAGKMVAELRGHDDKVNCAAFGPDGTLVVTASDDGRARVWRVVTRQMVAETKKHGTWLGMGWQAVIGAAFFPDGNLVATTASDAKVRMWDPSSGKFKGELDGKDAFAVRAYCSLGGRYLLVEHKDGWGRIPRDIQTDKLWTALRQAQMGKFAAALADASLLAVPEPSFSGDGKKAITAGDDGVARIWHAATGEIACVLNVREDHPVRAVAFHPNGRWAATAASETVQVWDVDNGTVVTELRGHGNAVNSVAFGADGTLAVTASDDGTARVWRVPAGQ
jgi:WD40 repeat protein/tetratricopeptide (TPR) repeat protein